MYIYIFFFYLYINTYTNTHACIHIYGRVAKDSRIIHPRLQAELRRQSSYSEITYTKSPVSEKKLSSLLELCY